MMTIEDNQPVKYAIRTRKGFIQATTGGHGRTPMYYLTPDLEKAMLIENKGVAIQLATRVATMEPVIKEVVTDPMTWKRKTIGTVVF